MTTNPPKLPMLEALAAVPAPQLKALLRILMAACAVSYHGATNAELKQLGKENASAAHRAALALSSEIVPELVKIIGGKEADQDELTTMLKELRQGVRYEVKTDRDISHEVLDILAATTAYLINYGQPALNKIRKMAPSLGDPVITQNFITEVDSQDDFKKPLGKIVKKVTGRDGSILTQEESLKLKERAPEVHAEYLRLRKGFNQVWKDEMKNFVFQSKKPTVTYSSLLAYFDKNKIETPLPRGFAGMIDANGKLYTTANKAINGVPGLGFDVVMNPQYDSKTDDQYVFTTVGPDGKISQYVYTVEYRKAKNKEKFAKVADLSGAIGELRNKWLPYVKKGDITSPQVVASTVLELLYEFSARVGSAGNSTGGVATMGISTLEGRHLKVMPGKILIAYQGKGGVRQRHLVDASAGPVAKVVYNNLKKLAEGKGPKDRIFTFTGSSGREKVLVGSDVNRWFKKLGSGDVTIHKMRHVKGTALFQQLLKENEAKLFGRAKPLSQAQADAALKQLATKVGAMLGHVRGVGQQEKATGATALANYIDPGVLINYYERLNLRLPRFLLKAAQ